MNSSNCSQYFNASECIAYCNNDYVAMVEKKLESPMPWVGMYIAAASAAISLAMGVDTIKAFRNKKLWFPCKYFSLNAFSLTLLAVAVKLPMDLTSTMLREIDEVARFGSLVFMSTCMANYITSLGSMENDEIMFNLAALGILVITITVNVIIRNVQMSGFGNGQAKLDEEIGSTVIIILLLVILCSLSIMLPTAKKQIESAYQEMHTRLVSYSHLEWGEFTIEEVTVAVRRYWVMAQTGSPQFVVSRSVFCVAAGLMCMCMHLVLLGSLISAIISVISKSEDLPSSSYNWSIIWIVLIDFFGVTLGTSASVSRLYFVTQIKSSKLGHKSFKDELRIENYWTQLLVDWKESPLLLQNRHQKFRKLINDAKKLVVRFCIRAQVANVITSKLLLLISATFAKVIVLIKNLKSSRESRSASTEQDFSRYVVLLEGEVELPEMTVRNICNEVNNLIQVGRKRRPENMVRLVNKSVNFNGVTEFDSERVPSLHSHQEPPNSWSLPIVTLTSIAISLPNITSHKSQQLLRGVREGLHFANLIDKALDRNGELASIRNAADIVWLGIELYHKWQDISLRSPSHKNYTLQELSDIAKRTVNTGNLLMENPRNWPSKVISANSMYRITQTIMQANQDDDSQTEEQLFETLSIIISGILSACLTNIVTVITLKCRSSAIKEREESVREAALLLGESEEILQILQQRELPRLDPDKAAYIDEWRAFMDKDNNNPVAYVSAGSTTVPSSNGEQVIEIEG